MKISFIHCKSVNEKQRGEIDIQTDEETKDMSFTGRQRFSFSLLLWHWRWICCRRVQCWVRRNLQIPGTAPTHPFLPTSYNATLYPAQSHRSKKSVCWCLCSKCVGGVRLFHLIKNVFWSFLSWARNSMREFVRPWVPRSVPGFGPRWSNRKRPCPPVRDDIVKKY